MSEVVVGLDVHLKNTQVTVMKLNGEIVKKERIRTCKSELSKCLEDVPKGSKVALESVGFCWPWIDFLDELDFEPLLANPMRVKLRAEDVKNDKVDSKTLADLTRMNWLPTCYVPSSEMRWLRSLLRHRAFRTKLCTGVKNRTKSEFRKRAIDLDVNLGTLKGRKLASDLGVFEVSQNLELLEVMDRQTKEIEGMLFKEYGHVKPVEFLMTIPGIGFLSAVTLYAEICDIKRFSSAEKLAHYAGLVPTVRQSGEHSFAGKETRGDAWMKSILIEVAWAHVRYCPDGHLVEVFKDACKRKGDSRDAIKIVARKLVNVVWAVWTNEKEFMVK
ncbi:MAG: IS110 family transposase [Candidatus Bathyarchaeota archaeon]|nr:IS110 family transposase [Candidatus Bathyarchaeota archaeon]